MTCEVTTRSHPGKDHEEVDTNGAEFSVPRTERKVENDQAVRGEKHTELVRHKETAPTPHRRAQ